MDYLTIISEIETILTSKEEHHLVTLIKNAKRKGGTAGEILAFVCSLLKVYEKRYSDIFSLIKLQSKALFQISKECGINPKPNYDLLDELDW